MTKTIILGESAKRSTCLQPIVFTHILNCDRAFSNVTILPRAYAYIELICKNYSTEDTWDLMFAYDDPENRKAGVLYVGHWNDGIVL